MDDSALWRLAPAAGTPKHSHRRFWGSKPPLATQGDDADPRSRRETKQIELELGQGNLDDDLMEDDDDLAAGASEATMSPSVSPDVPRRSRGESFFARLSARPPPVHLDEHLACAKQRRLLVRLLDSWQLQIILLSLILFDLGLTVYQIVMDLSGTSDRDEEEWIFVWTMVIIVLLLLEVCLRIVGLGVRAFFSRWFNVLDLSMSVLSLSLELIVFCAFQATLAQLAANNHTAAGGGGDAASLGDAPPRATSRRCACCGRSRGSCACAACRRARCASTAASRPPRGTSSAATSGVSSRTASTSTSSTSRTESSGCRCPPSAG